MSSVVLSGDTSGSITLDAPAIAGSSVQTLVAATGTLAPLIADTAKTATSTSVDFTGIPSWVKRITVMFSGLSTNGTSAIQVQLGAGSITTSGYLGATAYVGAATLGTNSTTGLLLSLVDAATVIHGSMTISLLGSNTWVSSSTSGRSNIAYANVCGGSIALSGTLDRLRITTVNGTDQFDAGTINILYE